MQVNIDTATVQLLKALASALRQLGHDAQVIATGTEITISTSADSRTVERVWNAIAVQF